MLMVILRINLFDDTICYKTITLRYMKLPFCESKWVEYQQFHMINLRVGTGRFYFVQIVPST